MPYAQAAPSLVGEVLDGRYKVLKKLGEGGMGEVYAAEHVHIDKRFAIKLLRPEIVSNQEAVTRFQQEARSSSSIKHRNIIAIEDFGKLPDGRIYMCMELLNGQALNDLIQQPQPIDRLLNILIQTGHGLAAAHARGIVHRDMKPENIFVTFQGNDDIPKILDFGIAKVAGNDGQNNLTRTGTIFGTPFYMAPEQALGNPVDARTDIYAMGVIMYEVFAGSLPFQGESFMGILTQHITTEPEPVSQRAAKAQRPMPPQLADIIMRCMRKDPQQRFSTMDELVNALIGVYRSIAGAGMSTYMEAFPVSAAHPVQGAPMTGAHHIGGPAAVAKTVGVGGQPSGGHPMPSGGHPMHTPPAGHPMQTPSGSAPAVPSASSSSGLYDPSGSSVVAPKKSSMGLILAIFAVLAIGGGIALVVILSNKDESGASSGSGSQVASGSSDSGSGSATTSSGSGSATTASAGSGSGTTTNNGSGATSGSGSAVASSGSAAGSGSATTAGSGSDGGSGTTAGSGTGSGSGSGSATVATNGSGAGSDSGSAATVQKEIDAGVPEVKKAQVTLVAKGGLSAFEVYIDGAVVPLVDGEHVVEVPEGEEVEAVIKAKNYKDKTVKIGSKKRVFQFALEKIKVVTNNNNTTTNNNTTNNNTTTNPPPPKCTGTSADLSRNAPKGCREKFCATHTDPKSQAMCDAD